MNYAPVQREEVTFPVYIVEKISGDVDRYATYEVMQSFLEKGDVRTNAPEAYDWEGFILELEVGKEQSRWLKVSNLGTKLSCWTCGNSSSMQLHTKNIRKDLLAS